MWYLERIDRCNELHSGDNHSGISIPLLYDTENMNEVASPHVSSSMTPETRYVLDSSATPPKECNQSISSSLCVRHLHPTWRFGRDELIPPGQRILSTLVSRHHFTVGYCQKNDFNDTSDVSPRLAIEHFGQNKTFVNGVELRKRSFQEITNVSYLSEGDVIAVVHPRHESPTQENEYGKGELSSLPLFVVRSTEIATVRGEIHYPLAEPSNDRIELESVSDDIKIHKQESSQQSNTGLHPPNVARDTVCLSSASSSELDRSVHQSVNLEQLSSCCTEENSNASEQWFWKSHLRLRDDDSRAWTAYSSAVAKEIQIAFNFGRDEVRLSDGTHTVVFEDPDVGTVQFFNNNWSSWRPVTCVRTQVCESNVKRKEGLSESRYLFSKPIMWQRNPLHEHIPRPRRFFINVSGTISTSDEEQVGLVLDDHSHSSEVSDIVPDSFDDLTDD